ncbi:hypothetical protein [Pseudomonas plecoglossicida]
MSDLADSLQIDWDRQIFAIRRSIRYHLRRTAYFDALDKVTNMASVMFGSAAIYGVLSKKAESLALVMSALVTFISTINLVVSSAQRARAHADFVRQYVDLEKRLLSPPSEEELLSIRQDRLTIEASEPPVLHVLNAMCHNEVMRSMGYDHTELASIGACQRLFAHFFDFREHKIRAPQPPVSDVTDAT